MTLWVPEASSQWERPFRLAVNIHLRLCICLLMHVILSFHACDIIIYNRRWTWRSLVISAVAEVKDIAAQRSAIVAWELKKKWFQAESVLEKLKSVPFDHWLCWKLYRKVTLHHSSMVSKKQYAVMRTWKVYAGKSSGFFCHSHVWVAFYPKCTGMMPAQQIRWLHFRTLSSFVNIW